MKSTPEKDYATSPYHSPIHTWKMQWNTFFHKEILHLFDLASFLEDSFMDKRPAR
jgi:hypothetical protein